MFYHIIWNRLFYRIFHIWYGLTGTFDTTAVSHLFQRSRSPTRWGCVLQQIDAADAAEAAAAAATAAATTTAPAAPAAPAACLGGDSKEESQHRTTDHHCCLGKSKKRMRSWRRQSGRNLLLESSTSGCASRIALTGGWDCSPSWTPAIARCATRACNALLPATLEAFESSAKTVSSGDRS